ncbi:TPM domain-containing protein [Reichenbachiella sp.]|uniref:TPM domain-containing protein n=1 Tax=Reichenbachiella sp. TaxID=2184521 RepID=UPI003BAE353F
MRKKFEFSEADKKLVKEAVQELEQKTAGEMVVYFARESDSYLMACWKLGGLFGVLFLALVATLSYLWLLPASIGIMFTCLIGIGTTALGFTIPYFLHSLRVSFTPDAIVSHRVLTKARDIFLQEEIFNTTDRIGILIYISELEHQVQVLGDSGINAKIQQEDWNEVLGLVIQGIKANHPAKGIANAIKKCEELLLANDFVNVVKPDNELSDDMRIEE